LKEIGPSNELRKWFGHDPDKWDEFKDKFFQELDQKRELIDQIVARAKKAMSYCFSALKMRSTTTQWH